MPQVCEMNSGLFFFSKSLLLTSTCSW